MNVLDVVIVALAVAAAVGGYRLGFLARAVSWIGLAVGLYVAARFLPRIVSSLRLADPATRLLVATLVLIGGSFVGQAIGIFAGARLHRALPLGPIRDIDRGVGAGVGALSVLVGVWLLLPTMAVVAGWPARAATTSSIGRWVESKFPRPPDALQALRRLVGSEAFPQVFNSLHPGESVGPPPASSGLPGAVINRVNLSTVKVEGQACSRIQDGSGFVAAADTIVTNAHVVAGEGRNRTKVILFAGATLPATVVLFDPERDLAVLHVPGLGRPPLPRGKGVVGQNGAVFGHPGGSPQLVNVPAKIAQEVTALGQDLYNSHPTRRDVFVLSAELHPGDSGGPLVDTLGQVIGVAFAIAPDRSTTAYALTNNEVNPVLSQPTGGPVGTGPCLND